MFRIIMIIPGGVHGREKLVRERVGVSASLRVLRTQQLRHESAQIKE